MKQIISADFLNICVYIRLSMMASDRLTDNNPNIANLGDKNRPTNLADKFSELYSNEWTNALESLEKDYKTESETANIKTLLEIVKVVHFFSFIL